MDTWSSCSDAEFSHKNTPNPAMMMMRQQLTLLLLLGLASVSAFLSSYSSKLRRTSSLCGIGEWRDLVFDFPGTGDDRRLGMEQGAPPKEVCVLPFPYAEVLLQGETKQLRLYEERFIQLFEDCMANHCGIVGMGLLAESGIIQTMPLCEIEAYNRMGDKFGIFVTLRVVARATLVDLVPDKSRPYIKAVCTEIVDDIPPNLDLPNLVASNIENFMLLLSSMEHRLAQATTTGQNQNPSDDDDDDDEMQRRINVAKLEDRFYANDDDDDEEEDDSDDHVKELDRRGRFRQAYQVAMDTDTQGYFCPQKQQQDASDRTAQELTAISWAAFCTEVLAEDDATFRIQALDSESLLDRLKLASHMLQEKKTQLQTKLIKAGLRGDDEDSSSLGM